MSVNKYDASTGELTNIASGQRTWVGTQEAYKAAKQAGTLPNNAIIAITDDEQDHNHYSTEETETGMYWIDGKPIYRKVQNLGSFTTNDTVILPHNITNLDNIISTQGIAKNSSSNIYIDLPYAYNPNNSAVQTISVEVNGSNIKVFCRNIGTGFSGFAIIEYTKTTD